MRRVVDTNVAIVANGRGDGKSAKPSVSCRMAAITFLRTLLSEGTLLLDLAGEVQAEYRKHLNPAGQPGVGDRFYFEVLKSDPKVVERIALSKNESGEYADIPKRLARSRFDLSDRKFAALSIKARAPVVNATDSDWLEHHPLLLESGVEVEFLCGETKSAWFQLR